jgi:hypothetical protein
VTTTDVPAVELAKELGITVGRLLQRADDTIGRVADEQGVDAARGLTTRLRAGHVYLTAELAAHLRETA